MSDAIKNTDIVTQNWHLGHQYPGGLDPEYDKPWGYPVPPLKAYGNVTYLQFIDIITQLWERAHPELKLIPDGARDQYRPEVGYIVYHLDNKKSSDNHLKPSMREDLFETDSGQKRGAMFSQSFDYLVRFTAVHKNPRTAEEIITAFEDFMIVIQPQMGMVGVEKFFYNRRVSDRDETRFGSDVASRSSIYLIVLQRLLLIRQEVLEAVKIDVRLGLENATPDSMSFLVQQPE